jgi:hypothetical protein
LSNVLTVWKIARWAKVQDHVFGAAYAAITPHAQDAVKALLVHNGALSALAQQFHGDRGAAECTALRAAAYKALDGVWTATVRGQLAGVVYDKIKAAVQKELGLHVATAVYGCRGSPPHLDVGSLAHSVFMHVACAELRCVCAAHCCAADRRLLAGPVPTRVRAHACWLLLVGPVLTRVRTALLLPVTGSTL